MATVDRPISNQDECCKDYETPQCFLEPWQDVCRRASSDGGLVDIYGQLWNTRINARTDFGDPCDRKHIPTHYLEYQKGVIEQILERRRRWQRQWKLRQPDTPLSRPSGLETIAIPAAFKLRVLRADATRERLTKKKHDTEPSDVRGYRIRVKDIRSMQGLEHWRHGDIILKRFITSESSRASTMRAEQEIGALRWLNRLGCRHVPTYLGNVKTQDNAYGESEHIVFMTKVPGVTLDPRYRSVSLREQGRIRNAFDTAVREVHGHGVQNGSQHLRNVIWSKAEDKCYIIDFERAAFDDVPEEESHFSFWEV